MYSVRIRVPAAAREHSPFNDSLDFLSQEEETKVLVFFFKSEQKVLLIRWQIVGNQRSDGRLFL